MPTRDAIVQAVGSAPAPVVTLDTCTLLDLLRVLHPGRHVSLDELYRAQAFVASARGANPRVHLVSPVQIRIEFARNQLIVQNDIAGAVRKVAGWLDKVDGVAQVLRPTARMAPRPDPMLLQDALGLAQALLGVAHEDDDDDACQLRAIARMRLGRAPSRRAKSEVQDCMVVEHALAMARDLRAAGFQQPIVLVSANSDDYCANGQLHPDLAAEFAPVGLAFARNLGEAIGLCGGGAVVHT